jgi:predicted HTH transcriptional regulator
MLKRHHRSIPANPLLARPMYLFGSIEQIGTGTEMIIEKCVEKGLRKPEFVQEEDFSVILYRFELNDKEQVSTQVSTQVEKLLRNFNSDVLGVNDLMKTVNLKERRTFVRNYIQPALKLGLIEMTVPDKPNSRLQKYRLTQKGFELKMKT